MSIDKTIRCPKCGGDMRPIDESEWRHGCVLTVQHICLECIYIEDVDYIIADKED